MEIRIRFKNIDPASHADIEQRLHELFEERLQPTLEKHFPPASVRLFTIVEKSRHHQHLYRVALRLHLPPKKILAASEDGFDLQTAGREAMAELERQVRRHLSRIRREDTWKRKARRAQLHKLKGRLAAAPAPSRRSFLEAVRPLMPRLENVVRRELTYLRAAGDLAPDYPSVQDLMDETLVRAQRDWNAEAGSADLFRLLLKQLIDVLAEEVVRYRSSEEAASLEGVAAGDVLAESGEDWRLEYWQPDEVLRIEDLVPTAQGVDPEQALEREELHRFLLRALHRLPLRWRRAVTLVHMESLGPQEVAGLLDTDPDTLQQWLDHADAFLRALLEEAGLEPPAERAPVLTSLEGLAPSRESEYLPALEEAAAAEDA